MNNPHTTRKTAAALTLVAVGALLHAARDYQNALKVICKKENGERPVAAVELLAFQCVELLLKVIIACGVCRNTAALPVGRFLELDKKVTEELRKYGHDLCKLFHNSEVRRHLRGLQVRCSKEVSKQHEEVLKSPPPYNFYGVCFKLASPTGEAEERRVLLGNYVSSRYGAFTNEPSVVRFVDCDALMDLLDVCYQEANRCYQETKRNVRKREKEQECGAK